VSAPTAPELLAHWTLAPPLASLAAAGAAYAIGVRRARRWPLRRSARFGAGLAVLAVALLSGVDAWADRLQSVHMVQHTLLLLVAPPLLCAGAPISLALRTLRPPGRQRLAAALRHAPIHPAVGFLALAGAMLAIHLTPLYEARGLLHAGEHLVLVTAGLLFWAPLVGADPGPHRAGPGGRIAVTLAAMAPMGALSAVLLTAPPRSAQYAASAAAAGVDPAADQRAAAVVMWIGGGFVVTVAVLALAAVALWQEEARMRRREAVSAR
jgi:cytochrome c oxidase assembly factor CtaG